MAAAKDAFPEWRATPLSRRAEIMFRIRELIDANKRAIAEIVTMEHGQRRSRTPRARCRE